MLTPKNYFDFLKVLFPPQKTFSFCHANAKLALKHWIIIVIENIAIFHW